MLDKTLERIGRDFHNAATDLGINSSNSNLLKFLGRVQDEECLMEQMPYMLEDDVLDTEVASEQEIGLTEENVELYGEGISRVKEVLKNSNIGITEVNLESVFNYMLPDSETITNMLKYEKECGNID